MIDESLSAYPALDRPYPVSDEHRGHFAANGHAMLPGLASAAEVAAYRPVLEATAAARTVERRRSLSATRTRAAFLQSFNLWRVDDAVRRFVFVAPVREGGGRPARRRRRSALPRSGVVQGARRRAHARGTRTSSTGRSTPRRPITMWMPLADLDPEVGSMTFATGSHRTGNLRGHAISDESEVEFDAAGPRRAVSPSTRTARSAPATRRSTRAGPCIAPVRIRPTGCGR